MKMLSFSGLVMALLFSFGLGCRKQADNASLVNPSSTNVAGKSATKEPPENEFTEAAKDMLGAAEEGDAEAQYYLGVFYVNGRGVPKDLVEAYKWWKLSAAKGWDESIKHVALLEKIMSAKDKEEGQKRADAFAPKKPEIPKLPPPKPRRPKPAKPAETNGIL